MVPSHVRKKTQSVYWAVVSLRFAMTLGTFTLLLSFRPPSKDSSMPSGFTSSRRARQGRNTGKIGAPDTLLPGAQQPQAIPPRDTRSAEQPYRQDVASGGIGIIGQQQPPPNTEPGEIPRFGRRCTDRRPRSSKKWGRRAKTTIPRGAPATDGGGSQAQRTKETAGAARGY